jgi:nucleotide-binding universal stress UspA family protein
MQSILVPTDFSPTAYNAARYAIALAADMKATKIILYNAYQPYVSEDPELGLPLQTDMEEFKQISEEGLIKMQNALQSEVPSSMQLEYESDYNIITSGILEVCKKYNAELIIMGITNTESKLEEAIIGSSAVDVSKHSEIPVIIVPVNANYTGLKKVLLAVDFKKSAETTPVAEIKKLLDVTHAQLDILHVEANESDELNLDAEKNIIDSLLGNYTPQYHFIQGKDFTDAINQFVVDNNSDLIIVIPKKHGFLEGIFKRSHTKALAFHSHIPIMSIHE